MKLLSKDRIKPVQVILDSETYVCVKPLSAQGLMDLRERFGETAQTDDKEFTYSVISACLCDDDGNLLGLNVMDLPFTYCDKIAEQALKISGVAVQPLTEEKKSTESSC